MICCSLSCVRHLVFPCFCPECESEEECWFYVLMIQEEGNWGLVADQIVVRFVFDRVTSWLISRLTSCVFLLNYTVDLRSDKYWNILTENQGDKIEVGYHVSLETHKRHYLVCYINCGTVSATEIGFIVVASGLSCITYDKSVRVKDKSNKAIMPGKLT